MKRTKRILCAGLAGLLALTAVAFAATAKLDITVDTGLSVLVNGEAFHPKDAAGKDAMIFAYEGTTYAPLRALAEAYGLTVGWDQARGVATVDGSVAGPAASGVAVPDPHTVYILANAPRRDPETGETGDAEEFFYDFHWLGFEEDESLTVKVTEGKLPEGIKVEKDGTMSGAADKELETVVTVEVKGGERTVTVPVLFRFRTRGAANLAPVVLYGAVGDEVDSLLTVGSHNALYLADDLYKDPQSVGKVPAGPIGTKAGLDGLKANGLELREDILTNPDDNDFAWGEYHVAGAFTKATDGWVKVEIPVFPAYAMGPVLEDGGLDLGLSLDGSKNYEQLTMGVVEVYLNIISFG